jgi:excinuclease ABC subunit C
VRSPFRQRRVYADYMLALDREAAFDPARAEEFFESLPPRPAVVRIEPRPQLPGARPLLLRTADLRRRIRLLLGLADSGSRRLNLREYAAAIRFRVAGSVFEQQLMHWQHARDLWPQNYRERLRLHAPAFVKLNLANAYPRAYVTRRLGTTGIYFGPFATRRAAEALLEPFLDLFRIRRCQIKIRRDPAFPGCIYSEMKMCLAPCFGGCTPEEYHVEVARVASFLRSRGASLSNEFKREREEASAQLDFEHAATAHRRLDKADAVCRSLPELVRPLEDLNAVILQRATEENTIAVFVVRCGRIADPALLHFTELASRPRSVEQILRELIEAAPGAAASGSGTAAGQITDASSRSELEDHLALLSRWFYGRPQEGEIFFQQAGPAGWPYRRILRACSRLLAPPGRQAEN